MVRRSEKAVGNLTRRAGARHAVLADVRTRTVVEVLAEVLLDRLLESAGDAEKPLISGSQPALLLTGRRRESGLNSQGGEDEK